MTTQQKEVFTTSELAEMFSVTPRTISRWRKSGRLPAMRLARSIVRFGREAVEQFIRQETERTTAQQ